MKKLTVVTYLHQNETQFSRCVLGMNKQTFTGLEWIILTHQPIDAVITCSYQVVILPAHIVLKSDVLNFILPQITTPYIAYNDSDDKSFPTRFEQQVAFMDANKHVDICSAMFVVNDTDSTWPLHQHHDMIAAYMLINSPMANPVVMLKNRPNFWGTVAKYNPHYVRAQDYDFWFTCLKLGLTFCNMQVPVVSYHVPTNPKTDDSQEQFAVEIRDCIHQHAGLTILPQLKNTYNDFCKLRLIAQDDMHNLLVFLNAQKYRKPFNQAKQAFAWQLRIYLKNHGLLEQEFYTTWLTKLERKSFLEKILG